MAVRFERELDATPDEVWAALTEPALLERWLATATVDARPGGVVSLAFDDGHMEGGRILEFAPPRLLEYLWTFRRSPTPWCGSSSSRAATAARGSCSTTGNSTWRAAPATAPAGSRTWKLSPRCSQASTPATGRRGTSASGRSTWNRLRRYRDRVDLELLERTLADRGEPPFRAKQVWEWASRGAVSYDEMTNVSAALREALAETVPFSTLAVESERLARDGTLKVLFRTHDGHPVEAVLMRYRDGRRSICVSSQSGCPLTCTFCATGSMAFGRNLTASEMLDQVLYFRRIEPVEPPACSWGWASRS